MAPFPTRWSQRGQFRRRPPSSHPLSAATPTHPQRHLPSPHGPTTPTSSAQPRLPSPHWDLRRPRRPPNPGSHLHSEFGIPHSHLPHRSSGIPAASQHRALTPFPSFVPPSAEQKDGARVPIEASAIAPRATPDPTIPTSAFQSPPHPFPASSSPARIPKHLARPGRSDPFIGWPRHVNFFWLTPFPT